MAKKNTVPNLSFTKKLDIAKIMIQFDDDKPESIMELLDETAEVTFTLKQTQFSSIEFNNKKGNRKFKMYVDTGE